MERVQTVLDRRWFTNNGPFMQELEARIADYVGVEHCVAMCNGTVALEVAIRALGMTGEVIVPAYTFVATAHALQWQGIRPVFADMDPRTHNLDPRRLEELVTPRTSGILGVHVWGRACDTDAIEAIADAHGIPVLYDAAHALGCSHQGRMIGGFGACEVFSLHATKFVNSFEGGVVTTNDGELAERMQLMRNFGFAGLDRVIHPGTNGKMSEVCAAMGLTSLESIDEFIRINRRNYEVYREELQDVPGASLLTFPSDERNNYQYVVIEIDPEGFAVTRDELVDVLRAENVLARKYFWPGVHRMEPYRSLQPDAGSLLPMTERVAGRVVVLPTGESVTVETVRAIAEIIRSAQTDAERIRAVRASIE
jgi:dTDP-4-amino-4,6-dideoxygalactose transaminase